jgi:hypothetical protein
VFSFPTAIRKASTNCFRRTEVDVGIGGVGAANPGVAGDGAALVEGHELVEVVEIGEHLHFHQRINRGQNQLQR